jgi:predicted DNA-binding protein (MmcQ/YjbR family)
VARDLLGKLRAICLALPGAEEVEAWGHPTFRVRGKIFATFGGEGDSAQMSVKCTHEMQASLVSSDPRFSIAHYVGKHGWVTLSMGSKVNWNEIEALVRESYRQIAPARLVASLPPGR